MDAMLAGTSTFEQQDDIRPDFRPNGNQGGEPGRGYARKADGNDAGIKQRAENGSDEHGDTAELFAPTASRRPVATATAPAIRLAPGKPGLARPRSSPEANIRDLDHSEQHHDA